MKRTKVNGYFFKEKVNPQLRISYFTILTMKLTAILVLLFSIQVTANTVAQKIKLNVKNQKLEIVLNEIKKQSGYSFLINSIYLKKSNLVTIDVSDLPIVTVLDEIFEGQPFSYYRSHL